MTCKPKGVGAGRRGDVCLGTFWFISGSTGCPFFKEQGFSQGAVCSSLRMQLSLKPAACFFKGQGFFQVAVRASLRVQLSYPFKSLQFFLLMGRVSFKGAVCSSSLRVQQSLQKPAACFFKWQGFFQGAACYSLRVLLATASYTYKSLQFFL